MSTNNQKSRTKICAIRSCKYDIGTRDCIPMFCVPKDESRLREWCKCVGLSEAETLRGFVCIEHFAENDLFPATKTKNVRLKPCAKPTIFMFQY